MSTELVAKPANFDVVQVAQHFVESGWFKDAGDVSQAVVKILAGQEMGLGPMASMQGIHIIDGKPALGANLLGAQVKRSGRYNYRVVESTEKRCLIEFFECGEKVGDSEFTWEEASRITRKGKKLIDGDNWRNYPKAMLFARAMSQGVRTHCPDVTAGPAYVPEELGVHVNAEGEPIRVEQPAQQEPADDAEEVDGEVVQGPPVIQSQENVQVLLDGIKRIGWRADHVAGWLANRHSVEKHETHDTLGKLLATLTDDQAADLMAEIQRRADVKADA